MLQFKAQFKVRNLLFFVMLLPLGSCGSGGGAPSISPPVYIPLSSPQISWLLGEWIGQSGVQSRRIIIQKDPAKLVYELHKAQVGSASDPDLPVPTVCSYRYYASQFGIKLGGTGASADYTFVTQPDRIELISEDGTSANCAIFESDESKNIVDSTYILNFSKLVTKGAPDELLQEGWTLQKVPPSPSPSPTPTPSH